MKVQIKPWNKPQGPSLRNPTPIQHHKYNSRLSLNFDQNSPMRWSRGGIKTSINARTKHQLLPTSTVYKMVHLPKRAAQMDYYGILKLPYTCTTHEIKTAYRKQALIHHPDKNANDDEASARFQAINEAYEILSENETRRAYNKIKGFRHAKSDAAIPMTDKWARHQMYWGQGQTKKTFTARPKLFEPEFREDCWVDTQNIADHFAYLRLPVAYEGQALQKASLLHGRSSLRYEFLAPSLTSNGFFDDCGREDVRSKMGRDLK